MEMRCPKCGTVQQDSDTCIKCHVIISKYLKYLEERDARQYASHKDIPDDRTTKGEFPTIKVALIISLVFFVIVGILWVRSVKSSRGYMDSESGIYVNEKYGFKLKLSGKWHLCEGKTVLPREILDEYGDNYYLFASPSETGESMLIVDKSGLDSKHFDDAAWEEYVADISGRHSVELKSIDKISDFRVYRVGYRISNVYREDFLFMTNGQLIEIYFYVRSPEQSPELIKEFQNFVMENLQRA